MRSRYGAGLTIEEWATIMGLNPWRVAGFGDNVPDANRKGSKNGCCDGTCWPEWDYQLGILSRDDLALAISEAEALFSQEMGFYPYPHETVGEEADYPSDKSINAKHFGMANNKGDFKSVGLQHGKLITLGTRTRTLAGVAALTYSSEYHMQVRVNNIMTDVEDTFEATIAVPNGTTADQIEIYFSAADRLDEPKEEWQIRPIKVSVTGLVATITGRKWLLALPEAVLDGNFTCMDTMDEENFVTEVEVWIVATDATDQGVLLWESGPCDTPPCAYIEQEFCATVRHQNDLPFIAPQPATFTDGVPSVACLSVERPPNGVRANYVSGLTYLNGKMPTNVARAIAYLAASLLECDVCACGCTFERINAYRQVQTVLVGKEVIGTATETRRVDEQPDAKGNPYGTKHGAIKAWRLTRNMRIGTYHSLSGGF